MSTQLNGLLMERNEVVNCGKEIVEVGKKQQKRKLAHFKSAAKGALWFAESFGLIPECLDVRVSGSENRVKIPLTEECHKPSRLWEGKWTRRLQYRHSICWICWIDLGYLTNFTMS